MEVQDTWTDINLQKHWEKLLACPLKNLADNIKGRIRDLEKAGALIAAEIDRLQAVLSI